MLIWRFQAVIVIKHLLISLESFFMIVLVLVQHRDLVRVGPGALSGDQGAGDDVDTGVGGAGGVVRGSHAQVLSQVQLGRGEGGRGEGVRVMGEAHCPAQCPAHIHSPGHTGGRGPGGRVLPPLVHTPPPGVHEEVGDSGGVEAELPGDGDLHLLAGTLGLLKREVRERETWTDTVIALSHWALAGTVWSVRDH